MASFADMLLATNWQYAPTRSLSQSILSGHLNLGSGDQARNGRNYIKAYNKSQGAIDAHNYGGYSYDWSGSTSVVGNLTTLTRTWNDPGNNQHRPLATLADVHGGTYTDNGTTAQRNASRDAANAYAAKPTSAQLNQQYYKYDNPRTGTSQYYGTAEFHRTQSVYTAWGAEGRSVPGGINWDGPYLTTRNDMMGGTTQRVRGSDYPYNMEQYPALASQFNSGQINASQFFTGAMSHNVQNDTDQLNNGAFTFSAPPRVRFSFSGGRGSISGTGISFAV